MDGQPGHDCVRPLSSSGISRRGAKPSRQEGRHWDVGRGYVTQTSNVLWIVVLLTLPTARIVCGTGSM